MAREEVESNLTFAGFLVFHCPLKPDAVESLKMLADSSHRVGHSDDQARTCVIVTLLLCYSAS